MVADSPRLSSTFVRARLYALMPLIIHDAMHFAKFRFK